MLSLSLAPVSPGATIRASAPAPAPSPTAIQTWPSAWRAEIGRARCSRCATRSCARIPTSTARSTGRWRQQAGPVVLADVSDNAGGGAPSDATFLLERDPGTRHHRCRRPASTGTRSQCASAARQARARRSNLRLGGKCGPMSGSPLDLLVTVRRLASGLTQRFGSLPSPLGETVWLEANGVDIVVNDNCAPRPSTPRPSPASASTSRRRRSSA